MVTYHNRHRERRGVALLLCLFIISLTSLLAISILDTETGQIAALRNTTDYERALYLAGASVHHGLVELEADFSWRGTVSEGAFPADNTYSATAVDGANGEVIVTGQGVSGGAMRTLQVTIGTGS